MRGWCWREKTKNVEWKDKGMESSHQSHWKADHKTPLPFPLISVEPHLPTGKSKLPERWDESVLSEGQQTAMCASPGALLESHSQLAPNPEHRRMMPMNLPAQESLGALEYSVHLTYLLCSFLKRISSSQNHWQTQLLLQNFHQNHLNLPSTQSAGRHIATETSIRSNHRQMW